MQQRTEKRQFLFQGNKVEFTIRLGLGPGENQFEIRCQNDKAFSDFHKKFVQAHKDITTTNVNKTPTSVELYNYKDYSSTIDTLLMQTNVFGSVWQNTNANQNPNVQPQNQQNLNANQPNSNFGLNNKQ